MSSKFDPFSASKLNDDGTPVISDSENSEQTQSEENISKINNNDKLHDSDPQNKEELAEVDSTQKIAEVKNNSTKEEQKSFPLKENQKEVLEDFTPFSRDHIDTHVSIVFDDLIHPEYPELSCYENPIPEPGNIVSFEKSIAAEILAKFCENNFGYKPTFNV